MICIQIQIKLYLTQILCQHQIQVKVRLFSLSLEKLKFQLITIIYTKKKISLNKIIHLMKILMIYYLIML